MTPTIQVIPISHEVGALTPRRREDIPINRQVAYHSSGASSYEAPPVLGRPSLCEAPSPDLVPKFDGEPKYRYNTRRVRPMAY